MKMSDEVKIAATTLCIIIISDFYSKPDLKILDIPE